MSTPQTTTPIHTPAAFDPTQLADIHLPQPVSYWPPAPGWWISLVIIFCLIGLLWWWTNQRKKNPLVIERKRLKQVKTEAQRELIKIEQNFIQHKNAHHCIEQLSVFLRRYAVSIYAREQAASVTDKQWLEMLSSLSGNPKFSDTFKTLLTEAPYQSADKEINEQLLGQLFTATKQLLKQNIKQQYSGVQHV